MEVETKVVSAGRSGWKFQLRWWARWVGNFPVTLWTRVWTCRREGHFLYDSWVCMRCGRPWFFYDKEL